MKYNWDSKPDLNITPLVDVMLVLLAIMMVVAPTLVYEEKINLPQSSKTTKLSNIPPIHLVIDKNKKLTINKDIFLLNSFIDNFSLYASKFDKKAAVLISADKNLDYGTVMLILSAVKQAGFHEVSLATNG
ncbi:biopolymer transporter ExbD [Sulfurimonas sp.]|uniref:ExbD/TolR family protein n=1 Tax=Sulfurimonas sp. TaxID=2022749 RepID=UPI0025D3A01A|nr:biopolymer transporter ExbD [Sulfurimonas sp.]MDD5156537.1 biopolymer transporter ExbD [Sulfurimonas sp.]